MLELLRAKPFRIASVVAPAGYGKTTFAKQFIGTFDSAAICDCLDARDLAEVARRLTQALAAPDPRRGQGWALEQVAAIGNAGDSEALAVTAWSHSQAPAVVLFDNAECLADNGLVAPFLRRLIKGHARPFAVCSRRPFALPFGHDIGPEDVALIGPSDLAFTREETSQMLGSIPAQDLDAIMALCAGWPLAVSMIARMCEREERKVVLERIASRGTEELTEYLVTQFVDGLEPPLLETLIATAAIPRSDGAEISLALGRDCCRDLDTLCRTLPITAKAGAIDVHPLLRAMLGERFTERARDIVRRAIEPAERARDHTRVAELHLALGDRAAAAGALQDVGPYMLSTPSLRVSNVLVSLDDDILSDFPLLWCAALIYRGYAIPPEEWLRTATAIWSRLGPAAVPAIRTSVASCVLNAYTNMGRCRDAAAFLHEFSQTARPDDREAVALSKLWEAALDSFAGRCSRVEETTHELAPILAASHVTHALYIYEVLAPTYRLRGRRDLEYDALERAMELGANSDIPALSIVRVEAAFSAWFAGDDAEFARYLRELEAKMTPGIARGHRFFIACARGRAHLEKPGYEKMKARAEALIIATSLARDLDEARDLARRAVEAADACERPFYRSIARLAWAEVDPVKAAALRADARTTGAAVEAREFQSALEAVATERQDCGMLGPFIVRFSRLAQLERRIELRLLEGAILTKRGLETLGDAEYALLAALARSDRYHSASELAFELFPELNESAAHNRVYVYLHRLRKRFGTDAVVISSRSGYRLAVRVRVDTWEVEHLLGCVAGTGWDGLTEPERQDLQEIALRPVSRHALPSSLEQHVFAIRRRLRIDLALRHQTRGEWAETLALGKAMLRDDPCDESAHEISIRTLLLTDNRPGALAQWAEYRNAMRGELGVEPSAHLYALISAAGSR